MFMKFDRQDLEERLKERFGDSVRFTSKIELAADDGIVSLHVHHPDSNMQTDENAFEAWALALRLLGFDGIRLSWNTDTVSKQKHYNRFLYRVEKFKAFFPWLTTDAFDSSHIFGASVTKFINHGVGPAGVESNPKSESVYEEALYRSEAFRREHGISDGKLARQLPVGVFTTNPPAESSTLFTGSKSAIDLYGVDQAGVLKIFELKVEGNRKVGALSEVFFYWCVLDDVRKGKILPTSDGAMRDSRLTWGDVIGSTHIENYLISSGEMHPIVQEICSSDVLGAFPLACVERYQCD